MLCLNSFLSARDDASSGGGIRAAATMYRNRMTSAGYGYLLLQRRTQTLSNRSACRDWP